MTTIVKTGSGYQVGYDDGNTAGYSKGHTDGYNSGKTDGYNSGYSAGNTAGYNSGKTDGYNSAKTQFAATYLGTGTSFDIKSKYPNEYRSFTADNFICEATGNVSYGGGHGDANGPGTVNTSGRMTANKSYNASSGVLTAYVEGAAWSFIEHGSTPGGSGNLSVRAFLVRATQ